MLRVWTLNCDIFHQIVRSVNKLVSAITRPRIVIEARPHLHGLHELLGLKRYEALWAFIFLLAVLPCFIIEFKHVREALLIN